MNLSTFKALKPGDKLVSMGGTKVWTVESVNTPLSGASTTFQAIIKGPEFGLLKIINASGAYNWDLAPKAFFKVNETYVWSNEVSSKKEYRVVSVHTTTDGATKNALMEFTTWDGSRALMLFDEGDFESMTKLTPSW